MKYTNLYHINNLLQNSPLISVFYSKLQQLEQLQQTIASLLPKELVNYCSVGNLKNGVLILLVKSPVWKHQVNFIKMDLLEQLRKNIQWAGIIAITVVVDYLSEELNKYSSQLQLGNQTPANQPKFSPKRKHLSISPHTALLVNKIIDQEIKDQKLFDKFKNFIKKIS